MDEIIKLFEKYENVGGYSSIVRFNVFVSRNCKNKKVLSKYSKVLESFENNIRENNYRIEKSFLNFRDFVFGLEV